MQAAVADAATGSQRGRLLVTFTTQHAKAGHGGRGPRAAAGEESAFREAFEAALDKWLDHLRLDDGAQGGLEVEEYDYHLGEAVVRLPEDEAKVLRRMRHATVFADGEGDEAPWKLLLEFADAPPAAPSGPPLPPPARPPEEQPLESRERVPQHLRDDPFLTNTGSPTPAEAMAAPRFEPPRDSAQGEVVRQAPWASRPDKDVTDQANCSRLLDAKTLRNCSTPCRLQ